jgi:ribonucleoside-diphosphate reductase alpha chain
MVPTTNPGRRSSNGKQQAAEGEGAAGRNGSHRAKARGKGASAPKPPAKRGRKAAAGPGLVVERRWTVAGVDPFDAVEWDYRTAAITGEKGETVFEQRDVEVPRFWSQLATNVVVSKYFRGHLGDPAREHSVKQLIGRVVGTISGWGREQGYFASEADADSFRDELCHMLLHQKAAFNSPVWFNVGLPDKPRPQCSACFINSVEDTMESILQLAATEARLFKGGSGAGSNLSRLRSSREPLQGGGIASGPVSFMRGYDAFAGAIKSGGTTRRAAKMQILDIDHPDVVEFIKCKANEERKAWALIDAGYDGGFNVPGGAYDSVFFQNSNLSVRASDEFMHAVQSNGEWTTRLVLSKEPADTYKARDLMHMIAEGTHVCGDPGMQFDTTINRWHTCKATDRIYASNPCSEYMFLEDSACNLASLNLLCFRRENGEFDVEEFVHGCEVMITAQEILVDNASYPTEQIAINSHDFRPLGLGYANLGALLMARGLPYDSDTGRAMAGAITAVMTGAAYRQSARIAEHKEPFAGYAPNREAMLEVMALHRSHVEHIDDTLVPGELLAAAHTVWDETLELGRKYGYKNAQISVLAPTGTIAFLMDCDTTGIEPDIALVKYKTLVGGGVMKIVNQTVPEALRRLGYSTKQVSTIVDYIDANGTIEGAPGLREEDLPVFDCAFRAASGTRSIHYMGHIRMMAAAQPFISGAISKTVNVPEDATVEEIERTYVEAWMAGLKAVAIYRDNSKRTQPLSTKLGGDGGKGTEARPYRRKLPDERLSITHKFSIAGHEGYVTVGMYEDGNPGEIFITMSKEGSTISGLMDSFATAISLALQYGVPLPILVSKFSHARFEPAGWTNNKEIPVAKSVMDYIFRWLALKFHLAEAVPVPEMTMTNGHAKEADALVPSERMLLQEDAPPCSDCGSIMVRAGACYRCLNCGSTSGCG